MRYETSSSYVTENTTETSEVKSTESTVEISETTEISENYDDCKIEQGTLEETEEVSEVEDDDENYDDCKIEQGTLEETEEVSEVEDDESYDDCKIEQGTLEETAEVGEVEDDDESNNDYKIEQEVFEKKATETGEVNEDKEVTETDELIEDKETTEADELIEDKETTETDELDEGKETAEADESSEDEKATEIDESSEDEEAAETDGTSEDEESNELNEDEEASETEESAEDDEEERKKRYEKLNDVENATDVSNVEDLETQEQKEEIQEQIEEKAGDSTVEIDSDVEGEKVESEELNQEKIAENTAESIEEKTGEELTEEQKEEIKEEITESVEEVSEDGKIEAGEVQEETKETAEETSEQIKKTREQIEEKAGENISEIDSDVEEEQVDSEELNQEEIAENTAESIEEKTGEELTEKQKKEIEEELTESVEEASEDGKIKAKDVKEIAKEQMDDRGEEIQEEEREKETEQIEDEQEKEAEKEQEKKDTSYEEQIKKVMDSDEAGYAEVDYLKQESEKRLAEMQDKQNELKNEAQEKFQNVLKYERGTEGYKESLRDYNDKMSQYEQMQNKIDKYKEHQEFLKNKSVELRQAQITKGEEAITASALTLIESSELQQQYELEYYSRKPKLEKLKDIQNRNSETIGELSKEKESIKLAMAAKMDEISEYVYSRRLERYDTERDSYYQYLIEQYRNMQKSYREIDYNIVKLDENNKSIAEMRDFPYESVQDFKEIGIKEVISGTDTPEKTNYFVDESKAEKVLSSFTQQNWEKLSVDEKKAEIEKLADYNAEILAIDVKPAIRYYHVKKASDCGGYSYKDNTIYINVYNIDNSVNIADTISHEYRHCYQHMRAEKLENERDLIFRENFDNYIEPENDYAMFKQYQSQPVEVDARAYAKVISDKIKNYEVGSTVMKPGKEVSDNDKGSNGQKEKEVANKEILDGGIHKKVLDSEEINNQRKILNEWEDMKFREVFEAMELEEIKKQVKDIYENGKQVGVYIGEFDKYKEHYKIEGGHIEKVYLKSLQAADAAENLFRNNDYDGFYSPIIDRKTLGMMAWYHDTGMDGNIEGKDAEKILIEKKKIFADEMKKRDPEISEEMIEKQFEKEFRGDHPLQSAIHALRDRKFIEGKNVDADKVALGCLLHSKSSSGVNNIADTGEWEKALAKLKFGVAEFNENHPGEEIYFNDAFLRDENGNLSEEKISKLRSQCLCLRVGDANGHDTNSHISQNGKKILFDVNQWEKEEKLLPKDIIKKIKYADSAGIADEVRNAKVVVGDMRLDEHNDPNGLSRAFALGEGNFKELDFKAEDGGCIEKIALVNGDAYPLSTQFCIEERIKEINTAASEPNKEVVRLEGMSDKEFSKMVENMRNSLTKIDIKIRIDLGNASETTIESYQAFAARMKAKYGLEVVKHENN